MFIFTKSTMNLIAAIITSLMCLTLGATACKNEAPPAEKKLNFRYELSKDRGWEWHTNHIAYSPQLHLKITFYRLAKNLGSAEAELKQRLSNIKENCSKSCEKTVTFREKIGETEVYLLESRHEYTWMTFAYFEKEGELFEVEMTDQVDKKICPENWIEFENAVKTLGVYEE